jgi:peptidoglycan/LPS O-acetylase OafA/YrhL
MSAPKLNLRTLDMLRGILAVYVLLGHCRWLLWTGHASWMAAPHSRWLEPVVYASASLRYGREAVMIFFVLSGFFIHLRVAENAAALSGFSAAAFYRRRAHRLLAPYAFALVVTMALDAIGRIWFPALYHAATGDALTDGVFRRSGYSAASVIPALVALPSSGGYDFGSNGPLWSIAFEVIYYALYPAWLALRRVSAVAAYLAVPAISVMLIVTRVYGFPVAVLSFYPVWLTGAALAEFLTRASSGVSRAVVMVLFMAGCGLGLYVFGNPGLLTLIAAVLYGGAAVWLCATMKPESVERLPVRLFEYLGLRSYSIYIVHLPLVALMGAAAFASPGGRPFHGWLAAGGAVAAIAFGCLCFEICERHFVHHRVPDMKMAA